MTSSPPKNDAVEVSNKNEQHGSRQFSQFSAPIGDRTGLERHQRYERSYSGRRPNYRYNSSGSSRYSPASTDGYDTTRSRESRTPQRRSGTPPRRSNTPPHYSRHYSRHIDRFEKRHRTRTPPRLPANDSSRGDIHQRRSYGQGRYDKRKNFHDQSTNGRGYHQSSQLHQHGHYINHSQYPSMGQHEEASGSVASYPTNQFAMQNHHFNAPLNYKQQNYGLCTIGEYPNVYLPPTLNLGNSMQTANQMQTFNPPERSIAVVNTVTQSYSLQVVRGQSSSKVGRVRSKTLRSTKKLWTPPPPPVAEEENWDTASEASNEGTNLPSLETNKEISDDQNAGCGSGQEPITSVSQKSSVVDQEKCPVVQSEMYGHSTSAVSQVLPQSLRRTNNLWTPPPPPVAEEENWDTPSESSNDGSNLPVPNTNQEKCSDQQYFYSEEIPSVSQKPSETHEENRPTAHSYLQQVEMGQSCSKFDHTLSQTMRPINKLWTPPPPPVAVEENWDSPSEPSNDGLNFQAPVTNQKKTSDQPIGVESGEMTTTNVGQKPSDAVEGKRPEMQSSFVVNRVSRTSPPRPPIADTEYWDTPPPLSKESPEFPAPTADPPGDRQVGIETEETPTTSGSQRANDQSALSMSVQNSLENPQGATNFTLSYKKSKYYNADLKYSSTRRKTKRNYPIKCKFPWSLKLAQLALAAELELNKDKRKEDMLKLYFPDEPLNHEIVKSYCPNIESVYFLRTSAPRFCFVHLKEGTNAENAIAQISKIPFGTGFIRAELSTSKPIRACTTKPENIDPYTLYVGNLHDTTPCKKLKQLFPRAWRVDIGYGHKLTNTRYAFIRFRHVEDAIAAYRRMFKTDVDGRTIIIRFKRREGGSEELEAPSTEANAVETDDHMDEYSMNSSAAYGDATTETASECNTSNDIEVMAMDPTTNKLSEKSSEDSAAKDSLREEATNVMVTESGKTLKLPIEAIYMHLAAPNRRDQFNVVIDQEKPCCSKSVRRVANTDDTYSGANATTTLVLERSQALSNESVNGNPQTKVSVKCSPPDNSQSVTNVSLERPVEPAAPISIAVKHEEEFEFFSESVTISKPPAESDTLKQSSQHVADTVVATTETDEVKIEEPKTIIHSNSNLHSKSQDNNKDCFSSKLEENPFDANVDPNDIVPSYSLIVHRQEQPKQEPTPSQCGKSLSHAAKDDITEMPSKSSKTEAPQTEKSRNHEKVGKRHKRRHHNKKRKHVTTGEKEKPIEIRDDDSPKPLPHKASETFDLTLDEDSLSNVKFESETADIFDIPTGLQKTREVSNKNTTAQGKTAVQAIDTKVTINAGISTTQSGQANDDDIILVSDSTEKTDSCDSPLPKRINQELQNVKQECFIDALIPTTSKSANTSKTLDRLFALLNSDSDDDS